MLCEAISTSVIKIRWIFKPQNLSSVRLQSDSASFQSITLIHSQEVTYPWVILLVTFDPRALPLYCHYHSERLPTCSSSSSAWHIFFFCAIELHCCLKPHCCTGYAPSLPWTHTHLSLFRLNPTYTVLLPQIPPTNALFSPVWLTCSIS